MTTILERVGEKAANHDRLAEEVMNNPALLPHILEGLSAESARQKFGSAKLLRILAERAPELLYPFFDVFVGLLDHQNKILQWQGLFILSQLVRVDKQAKFDAIFAKYFSSIPGPVMITAATAIQGGATIALAKPEWADRVAVEVLKVVRARYQTTECRNVAIGHAITALSQFYPKLQNPKPVRIFVKNQKKNSRNAVRKKAEKFLSTYPA